MKKRSDSYVRSSALSLKFGNCGKRAAIVEFLTEYKRCVVLFVEQFWILAQTGNLEVFPSSALYNNLESWLTVRALQSAAKQASGICRGTHEKNLRRLRIADILWERGERTQSKKLRDIANRDKVGIPNIESLEAQLDSRFFLIEKARGGSWELWFTLRSFDSRRKNVKLSIPVKLTSHYKKFVTAKLLGNVSLGSNSATFAFEQSPCPQQGKVLGVDIGQKVALSTSDGVQHRAGNHGFTLKTVGERLCRRKRGGKGFARAQAHRDNLIRESVNRLNLHGVGTLRLERIKDMKRGKRVSRNLSHWSSRDILAALESRATTLGVRVEWVNPRWTSQRCSACGWVQRRNRKGEQFGCKSCGNAMNADLNAALNISAYLPVLPETAVRERWNMKGFFWNPNAPVEKHAHESDASRDIVREARKPMKRAPSRTRKIFQ